MKYKVPFEYKSTGYIVVEGCTNPEDAQDKADKMLKEAIKSEEIGNVIDSTPTAVDKRSICVNYLKSVIDEDGNRYSLD